MREPSESEGDVDVVEEEEEDEDEDEEDDEEENGSGDENQAVLENCFLAMVDTLAKQVQIVDLGTIFVLYHFCISYWCINEKYYS